MDSWAVIDFLEALNPLVDLFLLCSKDVHKHLNSEYVGSVEFIVLPFFPDFPFNVALWMVRTGQAGFLPSQHGVVDVAQDPLNENSLLNLFINSSAWHLVP